MSINTNQPRINICTEAQSEQWLRLSHEIVGLGEPLSLKLGTKSALINAVLQINWHIEDHATTRTRRLITKGIFSIKLPFKERVEYQFDGQDLVSQAGQTVEGHAFESFHYQDKQNKVFGWQMTAGENKIRYEDNRKAYEFIFEDILTVPPLITPGAILFSILNMNQSSAQGIYVGADKLYRIEFLKEKNDLEEESISVFQSLIDGPNTNNLKKLILTLFLDSSGRTLKGGEIRLPILGKLRFENLLK